MVSRCRCDLEHGYLCRVHREERLRDLKSGFYRGFVIVCGVGVSAFIGGMVCLGEGVMLNRVYGYDAAASIYYGGVLGCLVSVLVCFGVVAVAGRLFPAKETKVPGGRK